MAYGYGDGLGFRFRFSAGGRQHQRRRIGKERGRRRRRGDCGWNMRREEEGRWETVQDPTEPWPRKGTRAPHDHYNPSPSSSSSSSSSTQTPSSLFWQRRRGRPSLIDWYGG